MTQVARTTNDLIDASFRFLGEVGEDEPVTGTELARGLYILNTLIDQFSSGQVYIGFVQKVNFTFTPGQATYTFSNVAGVTPDVTSNRIVGIDYANYFVDTLNYPIYIINKSQYYNIVRLSTLQTRPGFVFLNRQIQESELTFYPVPDQAYPCEMGLKLMVDKFEANTNIENVPAYHQRFLQYALTRELKQWYPSGLWTPESEQEYMRMFNDLKASNELDMTIRPTQILVGPRPFYWPNIIAY